MNMRKPRTKLLAAACCVFILLCASGCSSIADTYRINFDDSATSTAVYADIPPAPDGSLDNAAIGPYKPLSTDSADAAHLQEVTERAYQRAKELLPSNLNKPAPAPVGIEKAKQEMRQLPYPATYSPNWLYPYYRPYQLPMYWPSWRYRHPGFRSGVGIWLSH